MGFTGTDWFRYILYRMRSIFSSLLVNISPQKGDGYMINSDYHNLISSDLLRKYEKNAKEKQNIKGAVGDKSEMSAAMKYLSQAGRKAEAKRREEVAKQKTPESLAARQKQSIDANDIRELYQRFSQMQLGMTGDSDYRTLMNNYLNSTVFSGGLRGDMFTPNLNSNMLNSAFDAVYNTSDVESSIRKFQDIVNEDGSVKEKKQ